MPRPTLSQLAFAMKRSVLEFPAGTYWLHQTSDNVYQITGHHIRESDGEPMIEYAPASKNRATVVMSDALAGTAPIAGLRFSRPAAEFAEQVFLGPQQTGIDEAPPMGPRFVEVTKTVGWARV